MTQQQPSELTLIAQAVAGQRSALLLGDDDLSLQDLREINDTTGFTFERYISLDHTLRVQEYHLTEEELALVWQESEQYL